MMEENVAEDIIERFRMKFLNSTRGCVVRTDVPELIIAGHKIGPFQSGSRVDLPNWVIESFTKHDLVDIVPEDNYESMTNLQSLYRNEVDQPHKLEAFHPLLYSALSRKMLHLQSDKTSLDPRRYDEIENMQRMVPFLVETRLSKIMRVAKSGAYQEKRKQMTNEEQWLCEKLGNILSIWRKTVE